MNEQEFKVGDVVELKSGGPRMTITGAEPNKELVGWFRCCWFTPSDHVNLQTNGFPFAALRKIMDSD